MKATALKPGRYRHFKGGEYEVQGLATHSETGEQLVVYTPLYAEGGLWVRAPVDVSRKSCSQWRRTAPVCLLGTCGVGRLITNQLLYLLSYASLDQIGTGYTSPV